MRPLAVLLLAALLLAIQVAVAACSTPFYRKSRGCRRHEAILPSSTDAVHVWYARPPHDARLYDLLRVAPNATLAEIQKSWRRLSREWHPDKVAVRRRARRRETTPPPPPPPPLRDAAMQRPPPPPPPPDEDDSDHEEYARKRLAELTTAYEILSDDHTRLLYHRYGLVGGTDAAVQLLTGRVPSSETASGDHNNLQANKETTEEQHRLLELMGYRPNGYAHASSWYGRRGNHAHNYHATHASASTHTQHHQRQAYLIATITERLRPLVEGTISQEVFVGDVYRDCNALKKSVFGAQILRCIGRAYRIEGYRVLRTMHRKEGGRRRGHIGVRRKRHAHEEVTDKLIDSWRDAKQFASAALASGKLVLLEQRVKKLEEQSARQKEEQKKRRQQKQTVRKEKMETIQAHGGMNAEEETLFASDIGALSGEESPFDEDSDNIGGFLDDEDDEDDEDFLHFLSEDASSDSEQDELEQELQYAQHQKKYSALLSAHQMKALWKVTKIELDRTIRKACRRLLTPSYEAGEWNAFSPSPPPPQPPPRSRRRHHHQHRYHHHQRQPGWRSDGWVGTTGDVVPMDVGRLRAAAAMILVGDIMVQCSKEGTSWDK